MILIQFSQQASALQPKQCNLRITSRTTTSTLFREKKVLRVGCDVHKYIHTYTSLLLGFFQFVSPLESSPECERPQSRSFVYRETFSELSPCFENSIQRVALRRLTFLSWGWPPFPTTPLRRLHPPQFSPLSFSISDFVRRCYGSLRKAVTTRFCPAVIRVSAETYVPLWGSKHKTPIPQMQAAEESRSSTQQQFLAYESFGSTTSKHSSS